VHVVNLYVTNIIINTIKSVFLSCFPKTKTKKQNQIHLRRNTALLIFNKKKKTEMLLLKPKNANMNRALTVN